MYPIHELKYFTTDRRVLGTIEDVNEYVEMKDVPIADIFELIKVKGFKKSELSNGDVPLIMSSGVNNGYAEYVDKYVYDKPCISFASTGSVGNCFAHRNKICLLESSAHPPSLLKLKPDCQYLETALGLLAFIMTFKFTKDYSYSSLLNNQRMMNETIPLPVIKSTGKINMNLLNNYVYTMLM